MTQQFMDGGQDLLSLGKNFKPITFDAPFNSATVTPAPGNTNGVQRLELTFRTLHEGEGRSRGVVSVYRHDFGGNMAKTFATSGLDTSVPGYAVSNYTGAAITAWTLSAATCHANVFSSLVLGGGSTANHSLLTETALGALTEITYSPGSAILSLNRGVGLGSTAEKLFVGRSGAAVHVLSDANTGGPTVFGTMNAATTNCWGMVESPLNASAPGTPTKLIFANSSIYTLSDGAAVGDAPVQVSSGLRNGGYIAKGTTQGIVELPNLPARVFFWMPDVDAGTATALPGGTAVASQKRGRIFHCNLEGTDIQELVTTLGNRVIWVCNFNNSIIASDGIRVVQIAADEVDLGYAREFTSGAIVGSGTGNVSIPDISLTVFGLSVAEGQLYVWGGSGVTFAIHRFDPAQNVFFGVSTYNSLNTLTNSDITTTSALGTIAYSPWFRSLWLLPSISSSTASYYQYIQPPGWSPYWWQYVTGVSANLKTVNQYAWAYGPILSIDTVQGKPFVLEEIIWEGEMFPIGTAGSGSLMNSGASIRIDVAQPNSTTGLGFPSATIQTASNLFAKFTRDTIIASNNKTFPDNNVALFEFWYRFIQDLGTSAPRVTANILPFTFRFLVFPDVASVKTPRETTGAWHTY